MNLNRRKMMKIAGMPLVSSLFGGLGSGIFSTRAFGADLELVKPGILTVACNGDMPGTSVKDGRLTGFDGGIMQWVGEQLGLKVEPVLMEWSAEIESLKSRRVDAMHGMMAWNEPRTKIINMTDPIYYVGATIAQKTATNWSTLSDLDGKKIATIQGYQWVNQLKSIPNTELMLYDTSDAAMRDLLSGRIDALFADPPLLQYTLLRNPDWDIHAVPVSQPFEEKYSDLTAKYNVVFGLSQEAPNLLAAFNSKIAEVWSNCLNMKTAEQYGLGDPVWFDPGPINQRAGKDRPPNWAQPVLSTSCKP